LNPREPDAARTCLGCRRRRPRSALIRIVRDPGGDACFDLEGSLPGRGAWVCAAPGCLDAVSPDALAHVLRAPVRLAPAGARRQELAGALGRRAANLLTIARRMRGVTVGPTGVGVAIAAGRARLLLLAEDATPAAAALWEGRASGVTLRRAHDAATLGSLLGRGPVTIIAVTVEGLAAVLLEAIDRWRAFAGVSCDNGVLQTTGQRTRGGAGIAAGGG
jgi:hypothetical protein